MASSSTVILDPTLRRAVLFDLDGVLTDTARVHAAAWKRLFDDLLEQRPATAGEDHRPFTDDDYLRHVDGKPRLDGIMDFLRSRHIALPVGSAHDPPGDPTAHGLAKLKDGYFRQTLATQGVRVLPGARELLLALRWHTVLTAVISASRNCLLVLREAGLDQLVDVRVDGIVADRRGLPGKPDPATFLEAARQLGAPPSQAVVVEDARAGVEAGRAGGFGLVIGVCPPDRAAALRRAGADVTVEDLAAIVVTRQ